MLLAAACALLACALLTCALLTSALILTGCRCSRRPPKPDAELLALVPAEAALLLRLDIPALEAAGLPVRRKGVWRARQLLLATGGRPDGAGRLRFLVLLHGGIERGEVLDSLRAAVGGQLTKTRKGEFDLYGRDDPSSPRLLFPRRGWMMVVSPGWVAPVLDLLRGRGRSVRNSRHQLDDELRRAAGSSAGSFAGSSAGSSAGSTAGSSAGSSAGSTAGSSAGSPAGWLVSHISKQGAAYLARRSGWFELGHLRLLEGHLVARRSALELRVKAGFDDGRAAAQLRRRLASASPSASATQPSASASQILPQNVKVEGKGRAVRLIARLGPQQLRSLHRKLSGTLTRRLP